jgi:hypothetical protein
MGFRLLGPVDYQKAAKPMAGEVDDQLAPTMPPLLELVRHPAHLRDRRNAYQPPRAGR